MDCRGRGAFGQTTFLQTALLLQRCSSELHRRLDFQTDRASVRRWAIEHKLAPNTRHKRPPKPNQLLDQLVPHANRHETHRELDETPRQAQRQAIDEKRSVIRPAPACPWWPFVWSQRSRVRVAEDGTVPVGSQRLPITAPPRSRVIRCLRQNGEIYYLKHAPDPESKPIVLLHCPVF